MQNDLNGTHLIKRYLNTLTSGPGVYRMLDVNHKPLYVGKAKNLRNRVSSYSQYKGHSLRIQRMIHATCSMMFLSTKNETEALLLEHNLIKQLKPKYNILLRDDKSFPYIFISTEHDFPRIEKYRGKKSKPGRYYGPFANVLAVNRTLETLQKVFLLRSCTDREVAAGNRLCLNYHLKRCSGPCGGKINKEDYAKLVEDANDFLIGKSKMIQEKLGRQMMLASKAMNFELAASLRDRIQAITKIHPLQGINPEKVTEADIFALNLESGQACVQIYFIRANQNWGNKAYYPKVDIDMSHSEVLEAFLGQFYLHREPARILILSHSITNEELMKNLLTQKLGRRVQLIVPQKGEKRDLVLDALRNAKESLAHKMAESATQIKLLETMVKVFGLKEIPKRIEVYDNSHIQGTHPVGAMIVSGTEGFLRSEYRIFNVRLDEIDNKDDVAMMKHVLARRFRFKEQITKQNHQDNYPDLILLDGGKGQLSAVSSLLTEFDLGTIPVVAVAKGPNRNSGKERIFLKDKSCLEIEQNDPLRYFIQRLRDEAHRFVIGAHRKKRSRALSRTKLDDIDGLGSVRKNSLLMKFGSTKEVSRASIDELSTAPGISKNLANKIHDYFADGN